MWPFNSSKSGGSRGAKRAVLFGSRAISDNAWHYKSLVNIKKKLRGRKRWNRLKGESLDDDVGSHVSSSPISGRRNRKEERKKRGIRILSIDGGGTRGIIPLEILEDLERTSGKRIHELFDLIIGTSTGGLLALGLGIKKMTVQEAKELYSRENMLKIFPPRKRDQFRAMTQNGALYDPKGMEKVLKEYLGEDEIMYREDSTPKVCVVSSMYNTSMEEEPFMFRNFEFPEDYEAGQAPGLSNVHMWLAGRATSAAVLFFPSVSLDYYDMKTGQNKNIHLFDGGLGFNSPAFEALREAKAIWPDREVELLISMGTGKASTVRTVRRNPAAVAVEMANRFTSSESKHRDLQFLMPLLKWKYYRINPDIPEFGLDSTSEQELEELRDATSRFIEVDSEYHAARAEILKMC